MNRFITFARILLASAALAALIPLARLAIDWVEVSSMVSGPIAQVGGHGFDWVLWQEVDGVVYAGYVHPRGPAARAGLAEGDLFFMLDGQQYFSADALKGAIDGILPGTTHTYSVQREDRIVQLDVRFGRYPTFLYPLSAALWHFSIWGFLFGAFFHAIGLIIVAPLAARSAKARFSLLLIAASGLWIFSSLGRLLSIQWLGPPLSPGGAYDRLHLALTFIGLSGWIAFPALLLHKLVVDTILPTKRRAGLLLGLIYLPVLFLAPLAAGAALLGGLGPVTLNSLVAPILFYACCFVAAAAALVLALRRWAPAVFEERLPGWSPPGSTAMLVIALAFGLSVLGVVPLFGAVTDTMAGWLIVGAQLLSIVPVVLVTYATLQHGKLDQVLNRVVAYIFVFGLFFFAVATGLSLLQPFARLVGAAPEVFAGLLAAALLLVFERVARHTRGLTADFFTSERRQIYRELSRCQEQMRTILSLEALAKHVADCLGRAFNARSAAVFLHADADEEAWTSGSYHLEPPYLTARVATRIWPYFQAEHAAWASNPELGLQALPDDLDDLLRKRGAVLALPVSGGVRSLGMIVLGRRRERRAVYNLEDVELMRSLCGQLALAVERLQLVEREKALVRQHAEAQLVALRAQINPHFLFNALNTIAALVDERPEEAEATVEHLAAMFRHILQTEGRAFVSLDEEVTLVRHYLLIEQARFGASLEVEIAIEPEARSVPLPAFALQTLVENAVKHGLARRRGGGQLLITAKLVDGRRAEITVSDTGVGIPELFDAREKIVRREAFFGMGLQNVASRLEYLYGRQDLLRMRSDPETGTSVQLLIPIDEAASKGPTEPKGLPASAAS